MTPWNRTTDPHTYEELTIAEYYRHVELAEKAQQKLEEEQLTHEQDVQEANSALLEKENTISSLEKRLAEVTAQATGVVDLHEPVTAYYADVTTDYYLPDLAKDHTYWPDSMDLSADSDLPSELRVLSYIHDMDDEALWQYATHTKINGYEEVIDFKSHKFIYVLQFPYGNGHKKRLFDPEYNDHTLYSCTETIKDSTWAVCSKEEAKTWALSKLRSEIKKTYKKLEKELLTKDAEK